MIILKNLIWMIFIVVLLTILKIEYNTEQLNKGNAISSFLSYYHDIDVPAAEARWFNVVVTTYDITFNDVEAYFNSYGHPQEGEQPIKRY